MFAKVFSQIFDSSIAEDYQTRHVFMDLLVLADAKGVLDMTLSAIARRTNVPVDIVSKSVETLMKPDPFSRSKEHEGRRLIELDAGRGWGWIIVNYCSYRELRDENMRREQNRTAQQRFKDKQKVSQGKPEVSQGKPQSAQEEGEGELELEGEVKTYVLPESFGVWTVEDLRQSVFQNNNDNLFTVAELEDFIGYWTEKSKTGKLKFTSEKTWETRRRMANAMKMIYGPQREIDERKQLRNQVTHVKRVMPNNLNPDQINTWKVTTAKIPELESMVSDGTATEIDKNTLANMKAILAKLEAKAATP